MRFSIAITVLMAVLISACTSQQQPIADKDAIIQNEERPLPPPQPQPPLPEVSPPQAQEPTKQEKLKEVNLYEDLVISSGELVINKSMLFLHGNLVVNGTGKLVVVDSEIHFAQDYNQQYRAYFRDDAVLEMNNVRLLTGGKLFNFEHKGNGTVRMKKVSGQDCCIPWHGASENAGFDITNSTIGLTINNNVTVTVREKSSIFFELVLAEVNGSFRLPQGDVDEFKLDIKNNGQDLMKIDVRGSSFSNWGTTLDKHTDITFVDTKITIGMNAGSDWQLPAPTVKVSGLKARKYDDYTLQFDTNLLRLLNTEVTSWYPQAWNGATIELSDSDLADLQNNGRDSKLIVRNSKVDIAIARENVIQSYYDSEIRQDVIVHDDAAIYLYNTKVGGRMIENGNGKIFIDGNRLGS